MLLPVPMPDELLASVLARLARLNGIRDLSEVAERCFGLEVSPSFIDARINLAEFCARIDHAYGEPEELLERLTPIGARRKLGEFDKKTWISLLDGRSSPSVGELTFFGAVELRFCPICRNEDFDQTGMTYWHQKHQLPVLNFCAIHGARLKTALIKRAALHQSFPLPSDFPEGQHVDLPFTWKFDFEIELSEFVEALTQASPRQGLLEQVLLEGLWEGRFLNVKGSLRVHELIEFLHLKTYQGDESEPSKLRLRALQQIVRSIRESPKGLAFGRAYLLCALFGNWRIVAERCKWLEAVGASVEFRFPDQRGQDDDSHNVKRMHRDNCLIYLADGPQSSRLGFTRQHYRSFRWLLHHDRAWLDQHLPVIEREVQQLSLL